MLDVCAVRFDHEEQLEHNIMTGYNLEPLLEHFEREGELEQLRAYMMAEAVRITKILSPRLHGIFKETVSGLVLPGPVELFVTQSAETNAFVVQATGEDTPGAVVLTSKIVEMMSDDELRFVFGHELAHYAYGHNRMLEIPVAVQQDENGEPQIPALLSCKLQMLGRLAEISADRVGYMLSGRSLDTAISVFFKLVSGLDEQHLKYDIQVFLSQLDELLALNRKEYLSKMSHPAIPIRVKALQMLHDELTPEGAIREKEKLDDEVFSLTHLMEHEASDDEDIHARDFLLAGGILAAYVDGEEPSEEMYDHLIQLILPFTSDPEPHFQKLADMDQARTMLTRSCEWLRDNMGEEKFLLFRMLLSVVGFDGKLSKNEEKFMRSVAESLGIPKQGCNNLIHEVRTLLLQSSTHSGGSLPRLK